MNRKNKLISELGIFCVLDCPDTAADDHSSMDIINMLKVLILTPYFFLYILFHTCVQLVLVS